RQVRGELPETHDVQLVAPGLEVVADLGCVLEDAAEAVACSEERLVADARVTEDGDAPLPEALPVEPQERRPQGLDLADRRRRDAGGRRADGRRAAPRRHAAAGDPDRGARAHPHARLPAQPHVTPTSPEIAHPSSTAAHALTSPAARGATLHMSA